MRSINLLLGFLEPTRGRILLDGHDIRQITHRSLREYISKLSQFPFFLEASIADNMRLGKPVAAEAEPVEACSLAHIHDVIADRARMPQGYSTVVDAEVLSGGQKRLIALARCLLRKPEVLLLDDPTGNLDLDQRARLVSVLRKYATDRTCLIATHDMDFVARVADRVIVLGEGRVVAEGTHEELLRREGLYRSLTGNGDERQPLRS